MPELQIIATSAFGIESIVADELKKMGITEYSISNGCVEFSGDFRDIAKANIWLRCSERVLWKIKSFRATDFEELFQETKSIDWGDFLPGNAIIHVTGKAVKSKLMSVSHCQSIVKKAIIESLKRKYNFSWFEEKGPRYKIEISMLNDIATLTIDTSGVGLHKRGYRENSGTAPLRETLAAAMVCLSKWNRERTLIDPFCGSGTILIEAAMIGKNMAPGLNREFAAQQWPNIPDKIWKDAFAEAKDLVQNEEMEIFGYDTDLRTYRTAVENSIKASVDDSILFQKKSFTEMSTKKKYGCIITNPPYGERLKENIEGIYRDMGEIFMKLDTWSYFVLTSMENFEKIFGKKSSKNRKLYNGKIKTYLYQYFGAFPPRKK